MLFLLLPVEGSFFDKFFKSTASLDPSQVIFPHPPDLLLFLCHVSQMQAAEDYWSAKYNAHLTFSNFCILQRAVFLENDREMEVAHSVAATAGDTEVFKH